MLSGDASDLGKALSETHGTSRKDSRSLRGDGEHRVSLDEVIETMRRTGLDMQAEDRETLLGGLAVDVAAC